MIRAIQLEWLKVKNYRTFWILLGMYFLALLIICFGGMFFLEYLKSEGAEFEGIDPTMLPIYDFPDIWQNATYLATFLRVLPAFIVIISITNDLTYNTLRQNIIDGISKKQYLIGKLLMIFLIAVVSTIFVFLSGLINGSLYSHVWGFDVIFEGTGFLLAYGFDLVVFCSFAFLLSLIIKKAGFVIVLLFLYTIMFEPIAVAILEHASFLRGTFFTSIPPLLPVQAISDMISVPFPKYIFREIVDYVPWKAILISTSWLSIYLGGILFILNKRDLK